MITPASARKLAGDKLRGFPEPLVSAYLAFADTKDLAQLDAVVLGVLNFYLVKKPATPVQAMPDETRLIEDLGCDSLSLMDTVFLIESLFDIKLEDEMLPKILTLGDLRSYLRKVVQNPPVAESSV
jgi:acyl carrier protein